MKKGNVTILASVFVMALVAAGVGAGTMAWFSTPARSTSNFDLYAATMDMTLTAGPYSFPYLIPGQSLPDITIKITNIGNMGIPSLAGSMVLNGGAPLTPSDVAYKFADKIEVVSWQEFIPGVGWTENVNGPVQKYETLVGDGALPLTLLEVAQSYSRGRSEPYPSSGAEHTKIDQFGWYKKYSSDWVSGDAYDQTAGYAIIQGGEYQMLFRLKFSNTAGNDLQGQSFSFAITFTGMQDYTSQRP